MENKMAEENFFISFIGIGGEAIIGKLDSEKIEKWKEKTEEELLYAAMNNNDICHYGGVFINESLEIIFTKGTKEYKFSKEFKLKTISLENMPKFLQSNKDKYSEWFDNE